MEFLKIVLAHYGIDLIVFKLSKNKALNLKIINLTINMIKINENF